MMRACARRSSAQSDLLGVGGDANSTKVHQTAQCHADVTGEDKLERGEWMK
jgi:hypothetical protein